MAQKKVVDRDMEEDIEYVIYCRKSTKDEDKQVQSIPDQIEACVRFANSEKNNLKIASRPDNYKELFFKNDLEYNKTIHKEDNDKDEYNAEIYKKYRDMNLFIVTETESAKDANDRPKRRRIIDLIKKWKIKWLLSYEPNRQARNMLEGWEIIDLVDNDFVDLKYVNFHFENNSNGKMMLWMLFAFAKQYSDNQSEVVGRWNKGAMERGKSMGESKHGYFINDQGYHQPHNKYFDLMQQAFRMKIDHNKSNKEIANWLNKKWFKRWYPVNDKENNRRTFKELPANDKVLGEVWIDHFYYGRFIYWKNETDLRDSNELYRPMISETDHANLYSRHLEHHIHRAPKGARKENDELYPFDEWMVISPDGKTATPNIPSKGRCFPRLEKLRLTKPEAILSDVIKPIQIKYTCKKDSEYNWIRVSFDIIERKIMQLLKRFKITEEWEKAVVQEAQTRLQVKTNKEAEERAILQANSKLLYNQLNKLEDAMISVSMQRDTDDWVSYNKKKKGIKDDIDYIDSQLQLLKEDWRNYIFELENFLKFMRNAVPIYKNANFVQKRKIHSILFSNVVINKKKQVLIVVKPHFRTMFSVDDIHGGR